MAKCNYKAFTPEEVEAGLLDDLMKYLLNHNIKNQHSYYDIHITTDGYCIIVEWSDVIYDIQSECGKFEFVDYDQIIMTEKFFPDNHSEMCYDEDDYRERLNDFLATHPGWVQEGPYGRWVNKIEEESLRKITKEDIQEVVNGCVEEQSQESEEEPEDMCDKLFGKSEDK